MTDKYYIVTNKYGTLPIDSRVFRTEPMAKLFKEELENLNANKEFRIRKITSQYVETKDGILMTRLY